MSRIAIAWSTTWRGQEEQSFINLLQRIVYFCYYQESLSIPGIMWMCLTSKSIVSHALRAIMSSVALMFPCAMNYFALIAV